MAELRDYHLPPAISWWPIAFGWWLLLLFILILIAVSIGFWRYRHKKFATIHYIQAELQTINAKLAADGNIILFIRSISKLLRRFALLRFPRHQVAKLTGMAWLKFLDDHGGQGQFQNEFNLLLTELPYQQEPLPTLFSIEKEQIDKFNHLIITWIKFNQQPAIKT